MIELVKPVLVIVIGYLLKKLVDLINKGFEYVGAEYRIVIDEQAFASLVLAVVAFLLAQLGISEAVKAGLL